MSDAPFQRPGSTPVGAGGDDPPATSRLSWAAPPAPDGQPPVLHLDDDTPDPEDQPDQAPALASRWNRTTALLAGIAVGVAGMLAVGALRSPSPLDLTPETFPDEVLGAARVDDLTRSPRAAGEEVDIAADFAEQRRHFRFAHGVDGATQYYMSTGVGGGSVTALSIANGRLPMLQPANPDGVPGQEYVVAITHDADGIQCVSQLTGSAVVIDPTTGEPVEEAQNRGSREGATTCVLRDERRGIDVRLDSLFSLADADAMTALYVDELRRIHELLIG